MLRSVALAAAVTAVGVHDASAASLEVQAERLKAAGGAERVGGGRGVLLSGRSALRGRVRVRATERLSVRARGRHCAGWPLVAVSVDGDEVARFRVRSARWRPYKRRVLVGAGTRTLAVELLHAGRARDCERAVVVDSIELERRGRRTFANPVHGAFADPMVLDVEDRHTDYYAYGTGGRLPVAHSRDLVRWRRAGFALRRRPGWVPQTGQWNPWAPSVIRRPARCPGARRGPCYVMFYSALNAGLSPAANCVAVAISPTPRGPFADRGPLQSTTGGTDASGRPPGCGDDAGYSNIDAAPFVDRDGRAYLYFSTGHECSQPAQPRVECPWNRALSVVPLSSNWLRAAGRRRVLLRQDAPWQQGVVEGPWMRRVGHGYQLIYSGGVYTRGYGMGAAIGRSPTGPFANLPHNPLLHDSAEVKSAGGGSLVTGPDGGDWVVYHGRPGSFAGERLLRVDRAGGRRPGSVALRGPSNARQPAP